MRQAWDRPKMKIPDPNSDWLIFLIGGALLGTWLHARYPDADPLYWISKQLAYVEWGCAVTLLALFLYLAIMVAVGFYVLR